MRAIGTSWHASAAAAAASSLGLQQLCPLCGTAGMPAPKRKCAPAAMQAAGTHR